MVARISYQIADALVRVLPAPAADRLAVRLARAAFALRLPARAALEHNLEQLLSGASRHAIRDRARAAFEHFALSLADFLRLARLDTGTLGRAVDVRGERHLSEALASRRGVIVLSAHLGNWEWGAAWLAARGARLNVVARPHRSRAVDALFARLRGRFGVRRLGARPLWVRAASALRAGEWVALMGDRSAPGARGSACEWARVLARRTGALVLPAVMLRLASGRYVACLEPPLAPDDRMGERWRAALRRHIVRHPGQWLAFEPHAGELTDRAPAPRAGSPARPSLACPGAGARDPRVLGGWA